MSHVYMSCRPKDNRLHGIAKQEWRSSDYYRTGDVQSTLFLLKCLSQFSVDTIRKQWIWNFCLGDESAAVRPANVSELIA